MTPRHHWKTWRLALRQSPNEGLFSPCTWVQAQQVSASGETWEYKQGWDTTSPSRLSSLPGHALTSVLQFSLMGEHLAVETAANKLLVPKTHYFWVQFCFHLHWHKPESMPLCLMELHLCEDGHRGTFGLYMHRSISEEVLFSCRKTIAAVLFNY